MNRESDKSMYIVLYFIIAILCVSLFLIIGFTWARYQETEEGELKYTTKGSLALSLWKGIDSDGDLVLGENIWEYENDEASLEFYIGNGGSVTNAADEDQEVTVRLMVGPGVSVDESTQLALWIEGDMYEGTLTEITESTPLFENFGSGWYYAFYDDEGKEFSWRLEGGKLSVLYGELTLCGAYWEETTLLQLMVNSDHHNRVMWNTLLQPFRTVTSDVLVSEGETQVVQLGELTEENLIEKSPIWIYFQSQKPMTGILSCEFLEKEQKDLLDVKITEKEISLGPTTTHGEIIFSVTEEGKAVLTDTDVYFTITLTAEDGTKLSSVFRAILPAKPVIEPETPVEGDSDPTGEVGVSQPVMLSLTTLGEDTNTTGGAIEIKKSTRRLTMSTLDDYYVGAMIPVMMKVPVAAGDVTLSLVEKGENVAFPRYTRYSEDDGESWNLLFYSDTITTNRSRMTLTEGGTCLILDLSKAVSAAEDEKDDSAASVEDDAYLKIYAECESNQFVYSGTIRTAPHAMTYDTSTSQIPLLLDLDGMLVFSLADSWAEAADGGISLEKRTPDGYEWIDLENGPIEVNLENDALTVSVREKVIPEAGTYRLNIEYRYFDVYFAETEITFFINYSDGTLLDA